MLLPSTSTVFFVSGCSVIGSLSINGRVWMTMPRDWVERKWIRPHMKAAMPFTISDLRQCPEFFDTVAERIWQAWWRDDGHPLDYISGRLRENMNATPIPFALVAHDGKSFLGTASVIASDLRSGRNSRHGSRQCGWTRMRAGAASAARWSTA